MKMTSTLWAIDRLLQAAPNKRYRPRAAWIMTSGFLVFTFLVLLIHIVGFPLGYTYLQTVCPDGCSLAPENVRALEHSGLSIVFYANLYMTIQIIYILVTVGIALLIVFKKPGQRVPLGLSCFLVGFSAYEGVDYPAFVAAYPGLNMPAQFLLFLGMGVLGMYALLTFPNGIFGSLWILGYFLLQAIEGLFSVFITNPLFEQIDGVFSLFSFPITLGILIYRYRRLLNARERSAIKWLILSWTVFILLFIPASLVIDAVTPADSLIRLAVYTLGFFGCGINIAGFLMAVLYANAFDIDVFVNRTLVYGSLTAILAGIYVGLVIGLQTLVHLLTGQVSDSPFVIVASTIAIAALFQPMRKRIQNIIDRRFYRRKYDAAKVVAAFGATLRDEVDLRQLMENLLSVVEETMQPAHVSLWVRPAQPGKEDAGSGYLLSPRVNIKE
jgi:hypothetical protein